MGTSEAGCFNVFLSFFNEHKENVCFNCFRSPESEALELFDSLEVSNILHIYSVFKVTNRLFFFVIQVGETYVLRMGADQQSVHNEIPWTVNEGDEILPSISFDKY